LLVDDAFRAPAGDIMDSPMTRAVVALVAVLSVAMPFVTTAQPQEPDSPLVDPASGTTCPLGRVAMVRGSDSEAREGGGFEAARANGIHGAVDLNGHLGEPIFAVADGTVVVAARSDWGKLGKTVILDHQDGGHTIYGHLHTVEVNVNSHVSAGQLIGTMGYSGNARALQAKHLPPHLHFAYVRGSVPLARIRASGDGLGASFMRANALAGVTGVLHPLWAVRFLKCWENPLPVGEPSLPARLIMR
jgi:murein DD-endopeptidase MepM/ murein hydrolase activator NlpD